MTPIESVWLIGTQVWFRYYDGTAHLVALCPSVEDAHGTAWALSKFHNRPLRYGGSGSPVPLVEVHPSEAYPSPLTESPSDADHDGRDDG